MTIFATRAGAAVAAARRIENALHRKLKAQQNAAIVLTGGTTPAPVYAHMAHSTIDWHRVKVWLSDERWVSVEHDDSNEKMLRETLSTSRASDADIMPYYDSKTSLEDRCHVVADTLRRSRQPFTSTLLGMGEDGHFASLFPDAKNLSDGLDMEDEELCIPVRTGASPHERLSLTLSALTMSDEILLLISGETKRSIVEQASQKRDDIPISHLFEQTRAPLQVIWSP